jgi:phosphoenolpyruvate carboxylase
MTTPLDREHAMVTTPPDPRHADEQALRDDIRLLGRLLGDVIRDQEGDRIFGIVESVRQMAVRFRRSQDQQAGALLGRLLNRLVGEQTNSVVRAFSYFSHLANIAEDHHLNRLRRRDELAAVTPGPGSVRRSLALLRAAGHKRERIGRFLDEASIVPVLTAHPTEVQRKSTLDTEREIARLLGERTLPQTRAEERDNVEHLRACVTTLWQTRMLRYSRLSVADEIENALSYYRITFLHQIPRLYADIEAAIGETFVKPARQLAAAPVITQPFLRMGSWIGGDRDGNPNVTAATLTHALQRQSATVMEHYLVQVHDLGAELSMSTLLVPVTDELVALANRSPDHSPHREDEPYRRALIGVYARLAATMRRLGQETILRQAVAPAEPYGQSSEFAEDLAIIERSLVGNHGARLATPRLAPLRRAVEVFGFHLASLDLRQSSDGTATRIGAGAPPLQRGDTGRTGRAGCSPHRAPAIRARRHRQPHHFPHRVTV